MSDADAASGAAPGLSYRSAGVDRATAARAKQRILELIGATATPGVLANPGGFGGLFRAPTGLREPVLVASADGVGTKLKVAFATGRHNSVGRDLVNHCVNDILVEGARPLFFLDYIGTGHLEPTTVEQIVTGLAAACREHECALLGGETAELPDLYAPGEYDLAGFVLGVVEAARRPGRARVRAGDVLVGLASSGFHTNGYSLLRKLLFGTLSLRPEDRFPECDDSVADVLLRVHRSYAASVLPLVEEQQVRALAHITGGGIAENLERVLPEHLEARVERARWTVPPEFRAIMRLGSIAEEEMFRTFNMGIGMILVVGGAHASVVLERLHAAGETAFVIGEVTPGTGGVQLC